MLENEAIYRIKTRFAEQLALTCTAKQDIYFAKRRDSFCNDCLTLAHHPAITERANS